MFTGTVLGKPATSFFFFTQDKLTIVGVAFTQNYINAEIPKFGTPVVKGPLGAKVRTFFLAFRPPR